MTDQERKAVEMALDALESCEFDYDWEERPYKTFDETLVNDAVDALRQALNVDTINTSKTCVDETEKREHEPAENITETVCSLLRKAHDILSMSSLPPKREWVSLTDEEIDYIWGVTKADYEDKFDFPRAIEAALKEKNT